MNEQIKGILSLGAIGLIITIVFAFSIMHVYENQRLSKENELKVEIVEESKKGADMDELVLLQAMKRHNKEWFEYQSKIRLEKIVEMTYYLPTGNACANTKMPEEGGTVAFQRTYLNCECDIYTLDGELIGSYHIDDTGYGRTEDNGKGTIQNANCVDVFFENEIDGRNFIAEYGNRVIVKIRKVGN